MAHQASSKQLFQGVVWREIQFGSFNMPTYALLCSATAPLLRGPWVCEVCCTSVRLTSWDSGLVPVRTETGSSAFDIFSTYWYQQE